MRNLAIGLVSLSVLLWFFFCMMGVPSVLAWTPVEGHISVDTWWTVADSPYRLIGNVYVDDNVTLTIEPGVRVEFTDGVSLFVYGSLHAVGNADAMIEFTSSRPDPYDGAWKTIGFYGDESETFTVSYCRISYAEYGITVQSLGKSAIRNSLFKNCSESGIYTISKTNLLIENNNFTAPKYGILSAGREISGIIIKNNVIHSKSDGIYAYAYARDYAYVCNLTIQNNLVYSCVCSGLRIEANNYVPKYAYDAVVMSNTISSNNEAGITIIKVRTNITQNSIAYNTYGIKYESSTGNSAQFNDIYRNSLYGMYVSDSTVNAEHNYWGDEAGPYHESVNPEGKGNMVNGDGTDLDFVPWLSSPIGTINERPTAVLNVDKNEVGINETVTFDASLSYDDGKVVYYFFDFGDGTNSSWTTTSAVKHKYAAEGTYNVTLIVIDDFGAKSIANGQAYITIKVVPEFPPSLLPFIIIILTTLIPILKRTKLTTQKR